MQSYELYDVAKDKYQIHNIYDAQTDELHTQLEAYLNCGAPTVRRSDWEGGEHAGRQIKLSVMVILTVVLVENDYKRQQQANTVQPFYASTTMHMRY